MKNTRKFMAAVMALTMVSALAPMTAFAANHEVTAADNKETTIEYGVDESFLVTIPMTVTLGNTANITAENVNLKSGRTLNVTLSETSETDNTFKLRTTDNDVLAYTITKDSPNGVDVNIDEAVLTVPDTDTSGTATLSFNAPNSTPKAGDYNGSVTFTISTT